MELKIKLSEEAREARNAYQREYKRRNPDKVRQYGITYWEKKVATTWEPIEVRIHRLHDQGFSLRDIAAKVGISHMQVSRILK
jgi:transcriptional regulator with XRE-family HTH domain